MQAGGNASPGNDERSPAAAWVALLREFRAINTAYWGSRAAIPIMFGIDAVHGHSNIVGATIFPHNVGLGAAHDPALMRRIGEITAREMAATGADWTYAPTVTVPRDDRWGRGYEGWSEDPEIVAQYSREITLGLQGELGDGPIAPGRIAATAKHFLADGGTEGGKDQGDARISEEHLVRMPTMHYKPGDDRDLALLRALKAKGVPTVAVLLSGRPLWVNREINAAGALVAAWLPGTEGGGVADVLIGDAQRKARFDFTGRLARTWPGTPDQATLNRGDTSPAPLFPYGYGGSYARPVQVGALSEEGAVLTSTGGDVFFGTGRMQGATRATLRDAGGERFAPADGGIASPNGVITMSVKDAGAQENGRALVWAGTGPGTLEFIGLTRDLSRQANGDMALAITYAVEQPPSSAVTLGVGCGEGCLGRVDITRYLREAPAGQLRTLEVKLSCLASAGAEMSRVDRPMVIDTAGRLSLVLREVRLSYNEGDAICPAR